MSAPINYLTREYLAPFQNKRANERHVADTICTPDQELGLEQNLQLAKGRGVKFVIIGVPEDIGPRANCGNGGAYLGWQNFLSVNLNQQANAFFDWSTCLLLGSVDVEDIQQNSYQADGSSLEVSELRALCQQIDDRVEAVLTPIFAHGFEVIVIGGGHNNAYPIIKSLYNASGARVACANLDPHADFRAIEGRHSGNPFRYAYQEGALSHYCVVGLHEQKNNQMTISALDDAGFPYFSYQSIFMSRRVTIDNAIEQAKDYVANSSTQIGVELDVDAIKNAGASAYSIAGFSVEQAIQYVHSVASCGEVKYLHLCEAAPIGDSNDSGQLLTQLLYSYLQARSN